MSTQWLIASVFALSVLSSCVGPTLPQGVSAAMTEAPTDTPARLWVDRDRVVAVATPVGPGGLPAPVRNRLDLLAPEGEVLFAGQEWGPAGAGFRVEKRLIQDNIEWFSSFLLTATGAVLERTHSEPLETVPAEVLESAMLIGRHVFRCEIVSGPQQEQAWRATVQDGGGRKFLVRISLDGQLQTAQRVLNAVVHAQ